MKILFVYTDLNVRGGAKSFQFGIGMISAVLKKHGHNTDLHYMFGKYSPDSLSAKVKDYKPDILAFYAVSPQYMYIKRLLLDLGDVEAFTILGGQHATLMPECLEEIASLDAICIGEGEYPMIELAKALESGKTAEHIENLHVRRSDGTIVRNPTRPFMEDLDELPFPDRELFDYQEIVDSDFNTALFMFSRGCPYKCTFCSNHALREKQLGKYVRFRSVDNCLAEIKELTTNYRIQNLYFNDDCFTANRKFLTEFCERYSKEFSYPFDINARPETLTDNVCKMLAEAGCRRVSIGIENGSEKFRRETLGRRQTNQQIIEGFEACKRAGLKTKSFNIVGFPNETPEIFQETIDLNAQIQPDSVIIGIFEPYPGTQLADLCEQECFIDNSKAQTEFIGRTDTILDMPQFPRSQIIKCFRNFAYNVYKSTSFKRALFYKVYYSAWGEFILKITAPFKNLLRKITMGV